MKLKKVVLLTTTLFLAAGLGPQSLAQTTPTKDERGKAQRNKNTPPQKIEDSKIKKLPLHQYAITEIDTGNYRLLRVHVENKGKGRAKPGKVLATLIIVEGNSFPPKFVSYALYERTSGSLTGWSWGADLPALESGKGVWLELPFETCQPCMLQNKPKDTTDKTYRLGVEVKVTNNVKMANGKLESVFADFIGGGFF